MREATIDDLVAEDDPFSPYAPPGFDYPGEMAAVAALRLPLETLTGLALKQDTDVDDASFFTDLYVHDPVPCPHPTAGEVIETFVAVRFSSFGKFFTVWGNSSRRPLSGEMLGRIAALVSEHGFLYVPSSLLDQPHPEWKSWGTRYFDYL
ncbi:MAG: hypothetical protein EOP84_08975 [Verrucomicrobiaceae bacterium]|nr:MAG: hypothetical protein EOP84_08975 [Verrucomicrobiaceae bacterium]